MATTAVTVELQREIEQFLYLEAALIDDGAAALKTREKGAA